MDKESELHPDLTEEQDASPSSEEKFPLPKTEENVESSKGSAQPTDPNESDALDSVQEDPISSVSLEDEIHLEIPDLDQSANLAGEMDALSQTLYPVDGVKKEEPPQDSELTVENGKLNDDFSNWPRRLPWDPCQVLITSP